MLPELELPELELLELEPELLPVLLFVLAVAVFWVFGAFTFTVHDAFFPDFITTVIFTVPAFFPLTTPFLLTAATFELEEVHFFALSPFAYFIFNSSVFPAVRL